MIDYYDRRGKPITIAEYLTLHTRPEYVQVARTEIPGKAGAEVSTVWLGADHGWSGEADPIIFETMVFGGPYADEQERYSTDAEARAGHEKWVHRVTCAADPERGLGAYLVAKKILLGYSMPNPVTVDSLLIAAWLTCDRNTDDGLNDQGVMHRTWPGLIDEVITREQRDDGLLDGER